MTHKSNRGLTFLGLYATIILALLIASINSIARADSVGDWLGKMSHAMQYKNYTGTYVYQHGDKLETVMIQHMRDASGERERLLSLDGEAREIVRSLGRVVCVWPDSKSVTIGPLRQRTPFSVWQQNDLADLAQYYIFTEPQRERAAGRAAFVLNLTPKDHYRYGYRLWIDEEHYLLLKSQMLNASGKPIEQIVFTSMALDDQLQTAFFDDIVKAHTAHETNAPSTDELLPRAREASVSGSDAPGSERHSKQVSALAKNWRLGQLPMGFAVFSQETKWLGDTQEAVRHVTLSDGLASVSVYVAMHNSDAATTDEQQLQRESRMNAASAYSRILGPLYITIVGEVPMATVRMIGDKIQLAKKSTL